MRSGSLILLVLVFSGLCNCQTPPAFAKDFSVAVQAYYPQYDDHDLFLWYQATSVNKVLNLFLAKDNKTVVSELLERCDISDTSCWQRDLQPDTKCTITWPCNCPAPSYPIMYGIGHSKFVGKAVVDGIECNHWTWVDDSYVFEYWSSVSEPVIPVREAGNVTDANYVFTYTEWVPKFPSGANFDIPSDCPSSSGSGKQSEVAIELRAKPSAEAMAERVKKIRNLAATNVRA
eukprot:TRINITY_DN31416_c0_g1_i1.p1 TRINITY_DN31416_c0_g1~~TRINITY_DN31416_c0_g1_i1.p1  ORF type:complete len:232 (+),score=47.17 TRINITY_DN31416_c0_g1_i1:100-795(+)